jgi:hypothetical protein
MLKDAQGKHKNELSDRDDKFRSMEEKYKQMQRDMEDKYKQMLRDQEEKYRALLAENKDLKE